MLDICKRAEHVVKHLDIASFNDRCLLNRIKATILSDYPLPFPDGHESGLDSHALQLTKSVIEKYVNVRLYHASKQMNEKNSLKKIRSKLTKAILFAHQ